MVIRWRGHEVLLVTLLTATALAGYGWHLYRLTAEELAATYTAPFHAAQLAFHPYRNLLGPQMGFVLLLYAVHWYLNRFVVPATIKWVRQGWAVFPVGQLMGTVVQLLLLALLLVVGANAATHYGHPHLFNYGPDYRLLSLFGYNEHPFSDLTTGVVRALLLLALYGGYVTTREVGIHVLEHLAPQRAYRCLITNQATGLVVAYLAVGSFVATFNVGTEAFRAGYFSVIPPVALVYFSTTYGLFPHTVAGWWWRPRFLGYLGLLTLLSTLPFAWLLAGALGIEAVFPVLLAGWVIQLVVTTPLAWLLYQQRQDQLGALRGVERQLGQSTAELQLLRAQINPHFLFNALNTLYGTALRERAPQTADGIQRLGDLMRFMLQENTQELIPLSQEVDYLRNYIALQTLRLPASLRLRLDIQLPESPAAQLIAPMLLQPFVENAFNYGISFQQDSWIILTLRAAAGVLFFEIRNSLPARPPLPGGSLERPRTGVGLGNVTQRLQLLYGPCHTLVYGPQGNEYVVQLTLRPVA